MIVAAFQTVTFFKLTLGPSDQLERVCRDLELRCGLCPRSGREDILAAIYSSPEILKKAKKIRIYVPALFLFPWLQEELRGIAAGTARAKRAAELSILFRGKDQAPPYWLEGRGDSQVVCFASEWTRYLCSNLNVLESFVKHELCRFLHARNPGVPAITEKLELPRVRKLGRARSHWRKVLEARDGSPGFTMFKDIYSQEVLVGAFSIDHFLPWSFVAHDQIWNLSPVQARTNSAKGDSFPDIEKYLPALAKLHWFVIRHFSIQHAEQNEYSTAFRAEFTTLQRQGAGALLQRYRELMTPQIQIAKNYGFRCGWTI